MSAHAQEVLFSFNFQFSFSIFFFPFFFFQFLFEASNRSISSSVENNINLSASDVLRYKSLEWDCIVSDSSDYVSNVCLP